MKYWVRCWNPVTEKVTAITFTLNEILNDAPKHHMYMADVGIILLNLEREKHGLPKLDPGIIGHSDQLSGRECC